MSIIEWIDNKNTNILNQIDMFFNSKEAQERLQSIYVYPVFCNILNCDNDYETMGDRQFTDPAEIYHCFNLFQRIIGSINMKVVFVPSIETFCMFMGWTAKLYKEQLNNTPPTLQAIMRMIDDYLIESQLSAGQAGFTKANLTKFRTQISGEHGNELVTKKEANDANKNSDKLKSYEELEKGLKNLGFNRGIEENKQTD